MEYKIIQVNNYLLAVVNDKKRGWFYCVRRKSFFHDEGEDVLCCNGDLSVEAHLPLNGADIIENLPLLPPLEQEDDVEKMAEEYADYSNDYVPLSFGGKFNSTTKRDFLSGYNQAKENYKYTNEDMLVIRNQLVTMLPIGDVTSWDMIQAISKYTKWFDDYVESLSQPKAPIGFECEIIEELGEDGHSIYGYEKTTTTPEGHTQWIGTYIYE